MSAWNRVGAPPVRPGSVVVEVDVARATGLPTRFTVADAGGSGSMVLRYYDYDRPVEIPIPPCIAN